MLACASPRSCGDSNDDSGYFKILKLEVDSLQLRLHRLEQSLEVRNEKFGQQLVEIGEWKNKSEEKLSAVVQQHGRFSQHLATLGEWREESEAKLARLDDRMAHCINIQMQLPELNAKVLAVSEVETRMQEDANKLRNAVSDLRLALTAQVTNFNAHAYKDLPALSQQSLKQAAEPSPRQAAAQDTEQSPRPSPEKDKTSIEFLNFKSEFDAWKQTVTSEMYALRSGALVMPAQADAIDIDQVSICDTDSGLSAEVTKGRSRTTWDLTPTDAVDSVAKALKQIEEEFYEFKSSVYDGAILVFSDLLYTEDSIALLFGVISSAIIQLGVLILIALSNFNDPLIWQKFAWSWRLEFAHQPSGWGTMVQMQNVSLARVICDMEGHIPFKSRQRELVSNLQSYTQPTPGVGLEMGLCMMMMMLAVWICSIVEEIRDAIKMTLAIGSISHSCGDKLTITKSAHDAKFHISSLGTRRMIFVRVLTLTRLFIAVALCGTGCRWLAQARDMEDLLLDAMALKFVVGIDEMMLDFLGLPEVRWMINNMAPLPAPGIFAQRRRSNHFIMPALSLLVGMSVWCFALFWLVLPYLDNMYTVLDLYCGGVKDFVAWRNETSGLLQVGATNEKMLRPDPALLNIVDQNIGMNVDS